MKLTALLLAALLAAPPAVSLRISTPFQFAPGYQRIAVVIEPHPANRTYCFIYDSDTGDAGSKCADLDGGSPRTRWIDLKRLPAGHYGAIARVERAGEGVISSAAVQWEVVETVPQAR